MRTYDYRIKKRGEERRMIDEESTKIEIRTSRRVVDAEKQTYRRIGDTNMLGRIRYYF